MVRVITRVVGASVAAVVFYFIVPLDHDLGILVALAVLVALLVLLVPMTVRHAVRIEESSTPMVDAAQSLFTLLALLIIGFATVNFTIANNYEDQFRGLNTKIDGLYFTMTVVSTVGFGDITAVGQAARVIVTVQMLFDLLFIGVAIRLLGRALASRHPQFDPGKP